MNIFLSCVALCRFIFPTVLSVLFAIFVPNSLVNATDYFVDFDNGLDVNAGTSTAHAWKHAPGDPNATANPLKTVLVGGDVVKFRGGVKYRGSVVVQTGGEQGKQITYLGDAWGEKKATIAGMDEISVSLKKCASDSRCFFVDHPEDTFIADLPVQIKPDAEIKIDGQDFVQSQFPVQPKSLWSTPVTDFWPIKFSQMVQDSLGWTIINAGPLAVLGDSQPEDMRVLIWGLPNWIHIGEEVNYSNQTGSIHFSSPKFSPFVNRLAYYGLSNHPRFVKSSFSFATISGGHSLVFRFPDLKVDKIDLEYSARDVAFDILGRSHLVFKGFEVAGFSGKNDVASKGNAFRSRSGTPSDVLISNNDISRLKTFGSAIQILGATDLRIDGNRVSKIKEGYGISLLSSANVKITNNSIDEVGITGISVINNKDVLVSGNRISHIASIHGNGISVYLSNRNVAVENNFISTSTRPITFHSDKKGQPMNLSFVGNLIYASGEGSIPIQSWGNLARDVKIMNNILISDTRRGIGINRADLDVQIKNNITDDVIADAKLIQRLVVQNNVLVGNASFGGVEDGNNLNPLLHSRIKSAFDKNDFSDPVICETVAKIMGKAVTAATGASSFSGIGPDRLCAR